MPDAIKILGAGIAGLTAAINLAKKGFNATVYEKASTVGKRFCNDFQGIENWSDEKDALKILKEAGIETSFWNKGFNEISVYTDLKKEFIVKDKKNFFYLIERGQKNSLDENLKKQALDAGARILFNSKATENECNIIATGPAGKKQWAIAKGMVFETDSEDSVTFILNNKLAFKGYAYLLIANKKATLGCVLLKDFSKTNQCFKNSLQAIKKIKKLKIKNKKPFAGYGTFAINKSNIQNQKLFVGEAADFQDSLLGFGTKYAFLSGYLAAKSIAEEKNYDELWKELLLNKLKASVSNRFIYEALGDWGYNHFVKQAIASREPRAWLKKFYSFSLNKKIVYPIAKFTKPIFK